MIKASRDKYLILLILTDGEIHDMEATISSIIDSCDLPMSILIVGVGEDDFENMEVGEMMRSLILSPIFFFMMIPNFSLIIIIIIHLNNLFII